MSNIEINNVLAQISRLRDQASGKTIQSSPENHVDFAALLKNSLDKVNDNQHYANKLAKEFEQGEPGLNLAEVMIAGQKASISFQAAIQVRNKLVDAYRDIMNMPM